MIRFGNLRFEADEDITVEKIARHIGAKTDEIKSWHLYKKAVDARKKTDVHYICSVDVELKNEKKFINRKNALLVSEEKYNFPKTPPKSDRPIVIGSGPAGLFAALMLAENGHSPILFERGECVEDRVKSVEKFSEKGILNPESNVQFGEGGAGTFSDGKLTTGIKNPRCKTVLEYFVRFGAPEEILYSAKPHIGTDLLCKIVKNMREYIIKCGGEIHFNSLAESFVIKDNELKGVVVNGKEIEAKRVILAIGHSARDTVRSLYNSGVCMIAKPFSVGARIEHSQEMINKSQYGEFSDRLGAADYKLSVHLENGRGVYTFCMCPGGSVVAAASENGGVVTNGMSNYKRDGKNSNAALLVGVNPEDFGSEHPLAGMEFQRKIEEKAFLYGGENYFAPAQLVGDFLKDIPSKGAKNIIPTYRPGVKWGRIDEVLPGFVCESMREAIEVFDRKIKGFKSYDAVLTAPETRSSSPVRIVRDKDSLQSNIKGIYPCGEGAGYAGGIMSAAVDGIVCAEKAVTNK